MPVNIFYRLSCSFTEIGTKIENSPVYANLTMASSRYEKIVLAFATLAESNRCSGTLFQILSEKEDQYYTLRLVDRNSLEFKFRLVTSQSPVTVKIDVQSINFCDTTRHIVNIERTSDDEIRYRVDGRKYVVKDEYKQQTDIFFVKPYKYYVGNTKAENDAFFGCISGAKFHLFTAQGEKKTVEPIKQGILNSNTSRKFIALYLLGTIYPTNTLPRILRRVQYSLAQKITSKC